MFRKIAYTHYPVKNMNRAADFYQNVLGMRPLFRGDEWSEFEIGGQRIALHHDPADAYGIGGAVVSLEAYPIEPVIERLKKLGVRFVRELQILPYGKLAAFLDSEGNQLGLYEPPAKP
jgi:predicted enzyme related to lactoylglutathione lyase